MSEEEKILKTIRYCANDYMKQEDGIQCFEWGDLWILNEYIKKLQQENQQLKEKLNCDLQWALRYDELFSENQQLKEKMNETLDRNIKYNVEIVDLQQENKQLKEVIEEVRELINFYETTEWGLRGYSILQKFRKTLDKVKENK